MARVFGPLLSAAASGPLAGVIGFVDGPRGTVARSLPRATSIATAQQTATRAMFRFLSNQWPLLSPPQQATWIPLADATRLAPGMTYRGENLRRWLHFEPPSQTHPATETGTQPFAWSLPAQGHAGWARINWWVSNPFNAWGIILLRTTTATPAPTRNQTILVVRSTTTGAHFHDDYHLPAGNYWYWFRFFTTSGQLGPWETKQPVTVT